uniref:Uncharacterized protein n=1 Tax=Anguilla anguilla TaxID=7936 RepID=A0A0E9WYM2_ANGAN
MNVRRTSSALRYSFLTSEVSIQSLLIFARRRNTFLKFARLAVKDNEKMLQFQPVPCHSIQIPIKQFDDLINGSVYEFDFVIHLCFVDAGVEGFWEGYVYPSISNISTHLTEQRQGFAAHPPESVLNPVAAVTEVLCAYFKAS